MKKQYLAAISILCAVSLTACKQDAAAPELTTAVQTENLEPTETKAVSPEKVKKTGEKDGKEVKKEELEAHGEAEESTTAESSTAEATALKAAAGALSDSIYDFQISIDGSVYQFPMPYNQLTADGWRYQGDENQSIRSGAYGVSDNFKKGGARLITYLVNFGINEAPASECYLGGVTLDVYDFKDGPDVVLAKGIQLGKSTVDDIKAAYGEPGDLYEGDFSTKLTYKTDIYSRVELSIQNDKGYLTSIDIKNLEEPEDMEEQEVDTSVPAITAAYKTPDAISESLTEYSVEFAGDLYTLPAPVSRFVENGWSYVDGDGETVVAGQSSGWVTLMKDNQKFKTLTRNYSRSATSLENCFVVDIEVSEYKCNLPMTVAGGITMGMTEEALKEALEGYPVKTETTDTHHYYEVEGLDSSLDRYTFVAKDGKVMQIEVEYQPKLVKYYQAMGVKE